MKKLIGVYIALFIGAHSLIAFSPYSGYYNGYPYGRSWNYPSSYSDGCSQGQEQPEYSQPSQQYSQPVQRSNKSFEQQYDNLIVMFTKDACPYCRYMMPIMKQVEQKYGKDIKFLFVDVAQNGQYASHYGFSTVPQIMYFKDGKKLAVHGSADKTMTVQQVEEKIESIFGFNP